ncbi:hypothetical protein IU449_26960 [Nocardia higoensis]|uniref:Uncharacterized protein n=1 Tax=Nocardia higoensis TaxID=228599 RepID=A0ABS0DI55_9NOCA|nr:hypothetical protein [Nocardia higoensis]MBF6358141.1 hypothetical protein [Nocardia higoensis]
MNDNLKTYRRLTLGELIATLDQLGDATVEGLDGLVDSYRGYYERNATEPCNYQESATVLANQYREQIGKPITGYKGGDYTVDEGELIYYAAYGRSGPNIIGLEPTETSVYRPVLLEQDYHL